MFNRMQSEELQSEQLPRSTGPRQGLSPRPRLLVGTTVIMGALLAGGVVGARFGTSNPVGFALASSIGEPPAADEPAAPSSGDAEKAAAGDDQAVEDAEAFRECVADETDAIRDRVRVRDVIDGRLSGDRPTFELDLSTCAELAPTGNGAVVIRDGSVIIGDGSFSFEGAFDDEEIRTCLRSEGVAIPDDATSISVRITGEKDGNPKIEVSADDETIVVDADTIEAAMDACLGGAGFPSSIIGPEGIDSEIFDRTFGDNFPFGTDSPFGEKFPFGDCDHADDEG